DAGAGAAVVRCDLLARGRSLLHRFHRRRHVEQAGGAGIPWFTAGPLSVVVLDNVLARCAARGHGGPRGLAGAAGARRAVSARVAGSVLDRVRACADKTAALRAAALSGDRNPHGRRARAARAVALLADARLSLVVHYPGAGLDHRRSRCDRAHPPTGVPGVATRGSSDD